MPSVKLSDGFINLREGKSQVLKIKKVKYDTEFNVIRIFFVDRHGAGHNERFNIDKSNGHRKIALNIFSTIAKSALNDFKAKDVDPIELEGHFIMCDVEYETVEEGTYAGRTFTRLRNYRATDDTFEEIEDDEDEDEESEDDEDLF